MIRPSFSIDLGRDDGQRWALFLSRLLSTFPSLVSFILFVNQLFHPRLIKGNSIFLDRILIDPSMISKVDVYSSLNSTCQNALVLNSTLQTLLRFPTELEVLERNLSYKLEILLEFPFGTGMIVIKFHSGDPRACTRTYTKRRLTTSIHIECTDGEELEEESVSRCRFATITKVTR